MYRIYEVRNGDTLASIANLLGVSPEVLATLNGISVSSVLSPNTYIVVPGESGYFDKYVVQKGDTIYAIADSYAINPVQLLKLNGLDDEEYIYPDQEILVPKADTGFYVTNDGDTVSGLTQMLRMPIERIARENRTIYLLPDQLIVYKK